MSKKKETKQNAMKHGAYSREPMLPGERLCDYEALDAELREEWAPEGATERGLVDRLIGLYWRKQRLDRYVHLSLQLRIEEIRQTNETRRLHQNLKNIGPDFSGASDVEAVEEVLSELNPFHADVIKACVPRETCQDPTQWGPAIAAYLSKVNTEDELKGSAKFIAMVNPDSIDDELDRSNRIDEAIDRTIKRLMQVKTAKQILPNMRTVKPRLELIGGSAAADPTVTDSDKGRSNKTLVKVAIPAKPDRSRPEVLDDGGDATQNSHH
jgi:hypothetical protein